MFYSIIMEKNIPLDILYYSNYCEHSQKIIQFLSKGGLLEKVNAFNIDKRIRDDKTNQTMIVMENGQKVLLPPNIHSVPALLLINNNYKVLFAFSIIIVFALGKSIPTSIIVVETKIIIFLFSI